MSLPARAFEALLVAAACLLPPAASAQSASSAAILVHARIAAVKSIAERIVIDGKGADWQGIPVFGGSSGAIDDPSRHITAVAIAPREEDLLVMLRTAGRPSLEDLAFWLNVDYMGGQAEDFQLGIAQREPHVLWVYPPGQPATSGTLSAIQYAIDEVVEIRIPYAVLARALPGPMADALRGAAARSWMRVSPFTWNYRTRAFVAWGAAVASYRLLPGLAPLDPPLPAPGDAARTLPLPLSGKWYVGQGAFGAWTHGNSWAYDLYIVDATLHPSRVRDSNNPDDYYSWDQSVIAPADGKVIRSRSTSRDQAARQSLQNGDPPNELYLDIGERVGYWIAHFKQGTPAIGPGASVAPGQALGLIGHSGSTTWPHLHIGLWRLPEGRQTLPMALARVRVGLNPGADDPWARSLEAWDIREGFFVERLPSP